MSDPVPGSAASEPTRITFSGLTFRLSEQRPEGICEACDGIVALTNDAMYEHAARCPSKGWAHGV